MNEESSTSTISKEFLKSVLKEQKQHFEQLDLGVQREQLEEVGKHLQTPQAVVFSGLRRVGKSTLMAQIARKFYPQNHYFVNFEDERLINFRVEDFNFLYETLLELFGEKKVFMFDEIQNVSGWERFVRRMIDSGFKFYLTGSNTSLLSQELGTLLTGRYLSLPVLPFSFGEFLKFRGEPISFEQTLSTTEKAKLKKEFNHYLQYGGIPDALKYPEVEWPRILYRDVLYRDVATRYQIKDVRALEELAFYLISNPSSLFSFNRLKEFLKVGSVNTIKNYVEFLQTGWLFFVVNRYAYSVRKQQIAAKKLYVIDNGLINSVAFSFSEDRGKFLENLVFLEFRRRGEDIYYYKTKKDHEVDFYLPKTKQLVQVSQSLEREETRQREVRSLVEAGKELSVKNLLLLTEEGRDSVNVEGTEISVESVFRWLL